eukprot:PhM_4_TR6203/c0_g1_i1/m.78984
MDPFDDDAGFSPSGAKVIMPPTPIAIEFESRAEDGAWMPWKAEPTPRASNRSLVPVTVPVEKQGRFVVCRKHNKMRIVFACESFTDSHGDPYYECKEKEMCVTATTASAAGDGDSKDGTTPMTPLSAANRYFDFNYRDDADFLKLCWTCGSESHEATTCTLNVCPRCYESMENHSSEMCEFKADFDVCAIAARLTEKERSRLRCIICDRIGHANCARALYPPRKWCISCGNSGHYAYDCNIGRYRGNRERRMSMSSGGGGNGSGGGSGEYLAPRPIGYDTAPRDRGGRDSYSRGGDYRDGNSDRRGRGEYQDYDRRRTQSNSSSSGGRRYDNNESYGGGGGGSYYSGESRRGGGGGSGGGRGRGAHFSPVGNEADYNSRGRGGRGGRGGGARRF